MKTKILFIALIAISSLQTMAQSVSNISWYAFGAYACSPASATVSADLNYQLYNNTGTYGSSFYLNYRIVGYMPNANGGTTSYGTPFTVKDYKQGTFTFTVNRGNNLAVDCKVTVQGSQNGSTWVDISDFTCPSPNTGTRSILSSLDFSINGAASTGGLPTTILRCASGNTLDLNFSSSAIAIGTNVSYSIEKGSYSSNTFAPLGGAANTFVSAANVSILSPISLLTGAIGALKLGVWSGYVRVKVSMTGPCNTITNEVKIYNLDGNVEFTQKPTSGCLNTQVIQRYTDINFTNNLTGVFTTAPCLQGWMGATTCGINISSTLTGITKSQVKVDRVNVNGSMVTPDIYNVTNYNGMFASIDFNNHFQFGALQPSPPPATGTGTYNYSINSKVNFVVTNNWFSSNYNIIRNAATVFRITVNATNSSGTCSSVGYFKIADGGPIGQFWKKENNLSWDPLEGLTTTNNLIDITPNPAYNSINFYNSEKDAKLIIFDIFGKKIMEKYAELGFNNIDILAIPNGQYFININSSKGLSKGKFIKQ
jgi:Secretion system C-terminal sorting domain